ncbi:MAG: divalent metal cation transporter [Verrucomicrobia bacterium]|nr:divalent metal cation transporter [Verrucomicrobiota bacterium]
MSATPETRPAAETLPRPPSNLPRNATEWLAVFGPGAVIASLTIGAGELIFSSRGGAIFGYRLLWFLSLVLLLKWTLVYCAARHMVLTGAHPFQRWMELPGPRGWFPLVLFILALVCFPIWVSFHAGTIGTLLSWLTATDSLFFGTGHYLWGTLALGSVLVLVFTGGYARLERIQLMITLLMLICVVVSLFFLKPNWVELFKGLLIPQVLEYPSWITAHGEIASRPVWLEVVTYAGVIGGSGYDYLAYVSYLRSKGWGQAGQEMASHAQLQAIASDPQHLNRQWLRAPLIDCTLSFAAVLIFTAVFVACGAVVLGPQHKIPAGANLLGLQAEFVTSIYPWLRWVYFVGAFLAIYGTLYGTIEVAPTILREMAAATKQTLTETDTQRLRRWSLLWVGFGGLLILIGSLVYALITREKTPPGLIVFLTPANLFTGVLACGLICLCTVWMDCRFVPPPLRTNQLLTVLNLVAGIVFVALGLKGYWDHNGWKSLAILAGTIAAGFLVAWGREKTSTNHQPQPERQ